MAVNKDENKITNVNILNCIFNCNIRIRDSLNKWIEIAYHQPEFKKKI